MNDAIKNNRGILGKRKSFKDLRKEEVNDRLSNFENTNLNELEVRMAIRAQELDSKQRRSRKRSLLLVILLPLCLGALGWYSYQGLTDHQEQITAIKPFKEVIDVDAEGDSVKAEYFLRGPLAARSVLKNGMRHGQSESFYPTGELFRQAAYERDILLWERYYFKSGGLIHDFPRIVDQRTHRMELTDGDIKVRFSFYDGKIIAKTFHQYAATD